MASKRGVIYLAFGERAEQELAFATKDLEQHTDYPYIAIPQNKMLVADGPVVPRDDVQWSRWAKVNLDLNTPYEQTCYLDVDTRVKTDLTPGFELLDAGWDVVMTISDHQGPAALWHVGQYEREITISELPDVLQLQGGVFWFTVNQRTHRLFEVWRQEWLRFRGQDQAALMRALYKSPIKLWLLGRPWNGGAAIHHLFGRLR